MLACYRPPISDPSFLVKIEEIIGRIDSEDKEIVLVVDLNGNYLSSNQDNNNNYIPLLLGLLPRHIKCLNPPGGGGVLPEKLGRGVRPTSQNPHLIYYQNLRFFATLLLAWPKLRYDTLFMTFVAVTVALNKSYEGLLLTVLLIMMKK